MKKLSEFLQVGREVECFRHPRGPPMPKKKSLTKKEIPGQRLPDLPEKERFTQTPRRVPIFTDGEGHRCPTDSLSQQSHLFAQHVFFFGQFYMLGPAFYWGKWMIIT